MKYDLPQSLLDSVMNVALPELQESDAYDKFFLSALKKFGVSQPDQLPKDKRKEFYNYVDKNWKADNEASTNEDDTPKTMTTKLDESASLNEKATSEKQQKLMAMALQYKRGEMEDVSEKVKEIADSMSEKELEKFAKTKHDDIPTKKNEEKDPCWDGYEQLGTKEKDGKEVPNCVPKKDLKEEKRTNDPMIKKIASEIQGKSLMDIRGSLEKLFKKKNVDFMTSPNPAFMINHSGRKIVILNKKYADDPDIVVGELAIGYMS